MNKMKALVATTLVSLGIFALPLFNGVNRVAADVLLEAKLSVDKKTVERGQTLTYTFYIKNTTNEAIDPIILTPGRQYGTNHPLSPYVDYILGSTVATRSWDNASKNVDDAWILEDGASHWLNLGALPVGESFTVTFKAKVRQDAPNKAFIESVVQFKKVWLGEEVNEWVQCAASSTLKVGEVLGAELPETGASDVFAISGYALYLGVLLRKLKLNKYL